jgi:hypothetical protein
VRVSLKCKHCGEPIEPDEENGWIHSEDGVVGCGIGAGMYDEETSNAEVYELYAEPG